MPDAQTFNAKDAARYCGIGRATLYALKAEGQFPKPDFQVGELRPRWTRAGLDRWIVANTLQGDAA